MLLHCCGADERPDGDPSLRRLKRRSGQNTVFWFDLRIAQDKGLEFLSIKERCDLVVQHNEVVKSSKDDTASESIHPKKDQIPEEVRHVRLKECPYSAQRGVGNHPRSDNPILKITPRIEQLMIGVLKFQVGQGPIRRCIIENLTRQVVQSSHGEKLMEALEVTEKTRQISMREVHVSRTYLLLLWSYSSRCQRRSSEANR